MKLKKLPTTKLKEKVQEQTAPKTVRNYRSFAIESGITIAVIAFTILAIFSYYFPYFTFDLVITRTIQSFDPLWFDSLMRFVSYIGFAPQMNIIVALTIIYLFVVGLRWQAVVGLINAILVSIIIIVLKTLIGRARPTEDLVNVLRTLGEYSFPSGHVLFYTAFFGYLWFLSYSILKRSIRRNVLLFIFGSLVILIGPSRIYVGAHWSSDALGAYLFGSLWLLFVVHTYNWGKTRYFVRQPTAPEK